VFFESVRFVLYEYQTAGQGTRKVDVLKLICASVQMLVANNPKNQPQVSYTNIFQTAYSFPAQQNAFLYYLITRAPVD
jgi:hypothetical protein